MVYDPHPFRCHDMVALCGQVLVQALSQACTTNHIKRKDSLHCLNKYHHYILESEISQGTTFR